MPCIAMVIPGNAQHIGRRAAQEDAFAFSDLADAAFSGHAGAMCVVCDGMGGHAAGAAASNAAVREFLATYQAKQPDEPIDATLLDAVAAANDAVLEVAERAGDSGSTLAAVVIHDGRLFWVSVGDSRILLWREGRLFRVNREHHYRAELLRQAARGEIARAAAEGDPRGEQLTSSLGERPLGAIDHCRRGYPLQAGDAVFVASDGLYKTLDETALAGLAANAVAAGTGTPADICAAWVDATLARAAPDQDNVTVAGLQWPVAAGKTPADAGGRGVLRGDGGAQGHAATRRNGLRNGDHGRGDADSNGAGTSTQHERGLGIDLVRRRRRIAVAAVGAIAVIGALGATWNYCCRAPVPQADDAAKREQEGTAIDGPAQRGTSAAPPANGNAAASASGNAAPTNNASAAAPAPAKALDTPPVSGDAGEQRRSSAGAEPVDRRQARGQP